MGSLQASIKLLPISILSLSTLTACGQQNTDEAKIQRLAATNDFTPADPNEPIKIDPPKETRPPWEDRAGGGTSPGTVKCEAKPVYCEDGKTICSWTSENCGG